MFRSANQGIDSGIELSRHEIIQMRLNIDNAKDNIGNQQLNNNAYRYRNFETDNLNQMENSEYNINQQQKRLASDSNYRGEQIREKSEDNVASGALQAIKDNLDSKKD